MGGPAAASPCLSGGVGACVRVVRERQNEWSRKHDEGQDN